MAKTYLLRDIPDDLWPAARARAKSERRTMASAIFDLLRYYVQHGMPWETRS